MTTNKPSQTANDVIRAIENAAEISERSIDPEAQRLLRPDVHHHLDVYGSPDQLAVFLDVMTRGTGDPANFSFEGVLPMPDALSGLPVGRVAADALSFVALREAPGCEAADRARAIFPDDADDPQALRARLAARHPGVNLFDVARRGAVAQATTGFVHPGLWRRAAWGVDHDAGSATLTARMPDRLALRFATKDESPAPVFEAMAKRFPDLRIDVAAQHEDDRFDLMGRLENGACRIRRGGGGNLWICNRLDESRDLTPMQRVLIEISGKNARIDEFLTNAVSRHVGVDGLFQDKPLTTFNVQHFIPMPATVIGLSSSDDDRVDWMMKNWGVDRDPQGCRILDRRDEVALLSFDVAPDLSMRLMLAIGKKAQGLAIDGAVIDPDGHVEGWNDYGERWPVATARVADELYRQAFGVERPRPDCELDAAPAP